MEVYILKYIRPHILYYHWTNPKLIEQYEQEKDKWMDMELGIRQEDMVQAIELRIRIME